MALQAQRTNQGRTTIILFSLSPLLPQFHNQQRPLPNILSEGTVVSLSSAARLHAQSCRGEDYSYWRQPPRPDFPSAS
jgi:hypothetical protein